MFVYVCVCSYVWIRLYMRYAHRCVVHACIRVCICLYICVYACICFICDCKALSECFFAWAFATFQVHLASSRAADFGRTRPELAAISMLQVYCKFNVLCFQHIHSVY